MHFVRSRECRASILWYVYTCLSVKPSGSNFSRLKFLMTTPFFPPMMPRKPFLSAVPTQLPNVPKSYQPCLLPELVKRRPRSKSLPVVESRGHCVGTVDESAGSSCTVLPSTDAVHHLPVAKLSAEDLQRLVQTEFVQLVDSLSARCGGSRDSVVEALGRMCNDLLRRLPQPPQTSLQQTPEGAFPRKTTNDSILSSDLQSLASHPRTVVPAASESYGVEDPRCPFSLSYVLCATVILKNCTCWTRASSQSAAC